VAGGRDAILEAALRVIDRRGVDGLTHRAVAAEAGVSLASTTYHFASKQALVEEALGLVTDRSLALVTRHTDGEEPLTTTELAARLEALTVAQLAEADAPLIAQYELLLEAGRRPGLRPLAERWDTAYTAALRGLVGRASIPQPDEATAILVAALEGALLGHLAQPRPRFAEERLRPLVRRLVQALAVEY
jgi:DNA-binding transcriptional regulator YbjK